ncbi:hypothetical protein FNV43_RR15372 [Rhamnella rubrinervis]|uniref:Dof-type domain-containing protein n=1 Tax=Rhamnella rubrinervis TaxID=2594499 RepID=A0A8K0E6F0_9ROSA|nr:hypothetical protein FNV43_RR15372 [Rhamnella rubrinervis]
MSCESNSNGDINMDQAIKLFGRTIPVPEIQISATSDSASRIPPPPKSELMESCSDVTITEADSPCSESFGEPGKLLALRNSREKQQSSLQVSGAQLHTTSKEEKIDADSSEQEKIFKKPDKILPCPRCNSLETKFCYFNNYNVNQPRYFCKKCQRYWTAGGTMRNVPVGAGRRKNKHLASQYRQIMVSTDGVPLSGLETTDSSNQQLFSCGESSATFNSSTGNGRLIKFGPEAPLCKSMESVLDLQDSKRNVEMQFVNSGENGSELSCGSSMTTSSNQGSELPDHNVVPRDKVGLQGSSHEHKMSNLTHCYPIPPWVLPWNPASAGASQYSQCICAPNGSGPNQVQWNLSPMLAVPGSCPSSIPFHFVPASYWGCIPSWAAGTGNVSSTEYYACPSPSSSTSNGGCSGIGSPTLGKHLRDASCMDEEKSDKNILVPKTLRLDKPDEASKSPVWATFDVKPVQNESLLKGNIFRASTIKQKAMALYILLQSCKQALQLFLALMHSNRAYNQFCIV